MDALELAIEALSAEPCEDCISRKAVLDGINKYIEKAQSTGTIDDFISFEELVVKDLPSVQPKAKEGHWEYGYAFADGNYCKCSECKEIIKCIYPMHYCPNCGAKMESEG